MPSRVLKKSTSRRRSRKGSKYSADRLMRVALDLFSRRDFSTVTIKVIAKASNVNTALIYYYYDSKEDLFRAAIEFAIKKALERSYELQEKHSDPIYLINEWFRSNLEFVTLIRQLIKIMLDYAGSGHPVRSVDRLIHEFYRVEERVILANSIARGIEEKVFDDVDPVSTASFVSVHLDGIMVASMIRKDFNIEKALSDLRQILWTYLNYDAEKSAPTAQRKTAETKKQSLLRVREHR